MHWVSYNIPVKGHMTMAAITGTATAVPDHILAATKQLYEWFCPSVCLFVYLSVCHTLFTMSVCLPATPFSLCSHHRIIMKFPRVIANDRSEVQAKSHGQRSRSEKSKPNLAVSGNSSLNSHMAMKWCTKLDVALGDMHYCFQGHPSNFTVTRSKIRPFWPKVGVSGL